MAAEHEDRVELALAELFARLNALTELFISITATDLASADDPKEICRLMINEHLEGQVKQTEEVRNSPGVLRYSEHFVALLERLGDEAALCKGLRK